MRSNNRLPVLSRSRCWAAAGAGTGCRPLQMRRPRRRNMGNMASRSTPATARRRNIRVRCRPNFPDPARVIRRQRAKRRNIASLIIRCSSRIRRNRPLIRRPTRISRRGRPIRRPAIPPNPDPAIPRHPIQIKMPALAMHRLPMASARRSIRHHSGRIAARPSQPMRPRPARKCWDARIAMTRSAMRTGRRSRERSPRRTARADRVIRRGYRARQRADRPRADHRARVVGTRDRIVGRCRAIARLRSARPRTSSRAPRAPAARMKMRCAWAAPRRRGSIRRRCCSTRCAAS